MPYYEYECENGHIWSQNVAMSIRDLPTKCPQCESWETRRLYGAVNVHFKGTGWGKDKK